MPRIFFINKFYYPDYSATSQLLTSLAESMSNAGDEIHIITSRQLYENSSANLPKNEIIDNVYIHRLYTFEFGRKYLVGRAFDYFSFYVSLIFFLLFKLHKGDVLVAKTDPPLISVVAAVASRIKKFKLINWIQDLFPEIVNELSPGSLNLGIYKFLKKLRNWSLICAGKNIVISDLMKKKLIENGIDEKSIKVMRNWHVGGAEAVSDEKIEHLRDMWGLSGKLIIGYSGNLGRAHEYKVFLDAAEYFSDYDDAIFLFIGGGVGIDAMKKEILERGISNILFKEYQPLSMINTTLSLIDVHLITLLPSMEGLILPSKFYGIVAANRPVIFVGSEQGEIANLIKLHKLGFCVNNEDSKSLAEAIRLIYKAYHEVGRKDTYRMYSENNKLNVDLNADKWRSVLHGSI